MVLLPGGGNLKLMLIFMQCQNVYSVNIQKMFTMSDHHFILRTLMLLCKFVC